MIHLCRKDWRGRNTWVRYNVGMAGRWRDVNIEGEEEYMV